MPCMRIWLRRFSLAMCCCLLLFGLPISSQAAGSSSVAQYVGVGGGVPSAWDLALISGLGSVYTFPDGQTAGQIAGTPVSASDIYQLQHYQMPGYAVTSSGLIVATTPSPDPLQALNNQLQYAVGQVAQSGASGVGGAFNALGTGANNLNNSPGLTLPGVAVGQGLRNVTDKAGQALDTLGNDLNAATGGVVPAQLVKFGIIAGVAVLAVGAIK